jgi:hypothetical protein
MSVNASKDLSDQFLTPLAKLVVDLTALDEEHVHPDLEWHLVSDALDHHMIPIALSLELITEILTCINTHVFVNLAQRLTSEVKTIKEETTQKAQESKMLVQFENKLEQIKLKDKHRLKAQYTDMIEWLVMLF